MIGFIFGLFVGATIGGVITAIIIMLVNCDT